MASMAFNFHQKPIVLRTVSPISIDDGFQYFRLFVPSVDLYVSDFRSLSHPLDQFCLFLSRTAAATITSSDFFVAFPYGDDNITLVFPAEMEAEMRNLLQRNSLTYCTMKLDYVEEGTVGPGLVMQEALTHGLRKALVRAGWTVFDDNFAVRGNVTDWQDGGPIGVLTFNVQNDAYDRINFFLSPNVIRFRPLKINDLLSEPLKRTFEDGCEVVLEELLENMTTEELEKMKCLVVPSMKEGLVTGCCKLAPGDAITQKLEEVWAEKHGLLLPNEKCYVRVCFPCDDDTMGVWIPSCLVLKRLGLILAPPSVRKCKAFPTLKTFVSCMSGWNLFTMGKLQIDTASIEGALKQYLHLRPRSATHEMGNELETSNWNTAKLSLQDSASAEHEIFDFTKCASSLEVKFRQNFRRRPKPISFHDLTDESMESSIQHRCKTEALCSSGNSLLSNLGKPVFQKRKNKGNQLLQQDRKEHSKGTENKLQKPLGLNSKNNAVDNVETRDLPTKKILQSGDNKQVAGSGGSLTRVVENVRQTAKITLPANHTRKDNSERRKKTSKRDFGGEQGTQQKRKKYRDSKRQLIDQFAGVSGDITSTITNEEGESISSFPKDREPLQDRSASKPEKPTETKAVRQGAKKFAADIDVETNRLKILNKFAEGKLSDLTVSELKFFLSAKKSKVGGRKEELIQRIVLILRA